MHPHQNSILQKPHSRTSSSEIPSNCMYSDAWATKSLTPKRQFCKKLSQNCEN
jgi:hypothetical protein